MKNKLILILVVFFAVSSNWQLLAQISEGGLPRSFQYESLLTKSSDADIYKVPIDFSVEDLKQQDEWRVSQGEPKRIAKLIKVGLTMDNAGSWSTLPDGTKVWRLRLQASEAIAMNLCFDSFFIPKGAKLYVYNKDASQLIGAFTYNTNPQSKKYATQFIVGDDIIVEYEAAASGENPQFEIEAVGYGYHYLEVVKTKGTSGSCMVDVNCDEGAAWQKQKLGIVQMSMRIGDGYYVCSGSLMNNTAEDFKPYILSAYHCSVGEGTVPASADDYDQWSFKFGYENIECGSIVRKKFKTIVGCQKVASTPIDGGSDGLLLLLNQTIPEDYNVYYNGWDRENKAAANGVCLHHPAGDRMKVSTYTATAMPATWNGSDSKGADNAHWNVFFVKTQNGHGVTEGGSSGSPLFNQNQLVVGSLSGGNSSCEEDPNEETASGPDGVNLFGKLWYHWDQYTTADTGRMDLYLDPIKSGVETLRGRYMTAPKGVPSNLTASYAKGSVSLQWKAPEGEESPSFYRISRNNVFLTDENSLSYVDESPVSGSVTYSVSAIYSDDKESDPVKVSIYITDYKSPTDLSLSTSDGKVELSWKEPIYTQLLYWGNNTAKYIFGFGNTNPIYVGQCWDKTDVAKLDHRTITDVSFITYIKASYKVIIIQGDRRYEQDIENYKEKSFISVSLKTPFVIDPDNVLTVAVRIADFTKDDYPLVVDEGPCVPGKGDLISEDGITFESLYDPTLDEEGKAKFDYNVVLSINVSSVKGQITKSSEAAEFPNLTGYNVYRDNVLVNETVLTETNFVDPITVAGNYTYAVSAVYGEEESPKVKKEITAVSNISIKNDEADIKPTSFDNYVNVINSVNIKKLELIDLNGKCLKSIKNPTNVIDTSTIPSGFYYFRLYTKSKGTKVIKVVKK